MISSIFRRYCVSLNMVLYINKRFVDNRDLNSQHLSPAPKSLHKYIS